MNDLLSSIPNPHAPLAERLRPLHISEVVGQDHLTGAGGILSRLLAAKKLPSLILWGPPGTGKTTLARLLATETEQEFVQLSAVFSGVADLRKIFDHAQGRSGILLFIDEIHRFNKAQQDALLGPIESGLITLVGATTENPSFALNSALLSRARVLTLNLLDETASEQLLERAERLTQKRLPLMPQARTALIQMAGGDGRNLLNLVETVLDYQDDHDLTAEELGERIQRRLALYDKNQDFHYNIISAFIKSMRGSDPDAALYWFQRMVEAGEPPLYIARRVVRFAAEDIGLADPQALMHAMAAHQAYERLGSPEGELSIANAVVYCATAPKSNAVYLAFKASAKVAAATGEKSPPKHILNAPTKLMEQEGYGKGYQYDHDSEGAYSGQKFFPDDMAETQFYSPVERGFEREIQKRLDYWQAIRHKKRAMKKG
ncbi:replication-associated recombination protein A [Candidatus Odyssella acanthamoebae]|uniref:Replication-associated recombination protein A n=1 Tax=Candidatus Odyssella acanthamoebae TaxID=91604 RepID=A0A077B1B0_9PROT|nr:replication-associated recombination protein A [Candidatus Paracaedibacter acanthamoebae]AIK96730.1 ATPase AAA [Candidatus Paracaedibacter acanthamoebae]